MDKISVIKEKRDRALEIYEALGLRNNNNAVESVRRQVSWVFHSGHLIKLTLSGDHLVHQHIHAFLSPVRCASGQGVLP